jgi:catalase-peroxidase
VPEEADLAGPGARVDHELIDDEDIEAQEHDPRFRPVDLRTGRTAWASASTFRGSRHARRRQRRPHPPRAAEGLGGQRTPSWRRCSPRSRSIQSEFNALGVAGGKKVSLADLIVLGGCAAVEQAAKKAGHEVEVPFTPGPHRRDPGADRRGASPCSSRLPTASATTSADEKFTASGRRAAGRPRHLLTLTAPEMTVLVGGLRVLGANTGQSSTASSPTSPGR